MAFFLILGGVVVLAAVGLLIYARWNHGTLEKMGIPVLPHHPLLGVAKQVYDEVGALLDIRNMRKYGPVYGVYDGRDAHVYVCDAELVRQICVRDAEYFNARRTFEFGDPILNEMPDFLPYEKWKLVRAITTPAFSSAKIKMMNLPMREATLDFVSDLKKTIQKSEKQKIEKFALDDAVHTMLTDLITRCVFSIRINDPHNGNNDFARIVKELLQSAGSHSESPWKAWSHTFPFLNKFLGAAIFNPESSNQFVTIFKTLLDARRKSGVKKGDVVDLCLEWYEKLDTPEFKRAQVTELTLMCQALVFFFAAQDQISTMVAATLHHISKDKELEKRVLEEVDSVFAKHTLEHEHIPELVFLNACISESLRLYPFFYRTERVCTKDWRNEEHNLLIKKGTTIILPIWAINRNEEYLENPDTYYPDRWMPENKDKLNVFASTSFGHGPRSCTGKRFATESMPLITAYLLKELRFVARDDTELTFIRGGPYFAPHKPVLVDIVKRSNIC